MIGMTEMDPTIYKSASGWDASRPLAVDLSKIKVGDYVTVRTKVLGAEGPGADAIPITIDPNPWAYEIIGHEPSVETETVDEVTARIGNEMAARTAAEVYHKGWLVMRHTRKPMK